MTRGLGRKDLELQVREVGRLQFDFQDEGTNLPINRSGFLAFRVHRVVTECERGESRTR